MKVRWVVHRRIAAIVAVVLGGLAGTLVVAVPPAAAHHGGTQCADVDADGFTHGSWCGTFFLDDSFTSAAGPPETAEFVHGLRSSWDLNGRYSARFLGTFTLNRGTYSIDGFADDHVRVAVDVDGDGRPEPYATWAGAARYGRDHQPPFTISGRREVRMVVEVVDHGGGFGGVDLQLHCAEAADDRSACPALSVFGMDPVAEGTGTARRVQTGRVVLHPAARQPVRAVCQSQEAPTAHPARPGEDFSAERLELVFEPGQTERTCTTRVVGDDVDEDQERLRLAVGSPSADAARPAADVFVVDDDAPPVYGLRAETTGALEGAEVGIEVVGAGKSDRAATLSWTVGGVSRSDLGDAPVAGRCVVPARSVPACAAIRLPLVRDSLSEGRERLVTELSIDTDGRGTVPAGRGVASVQVEDADPLTRVAVRAATVAEPDAGLASSGPLLTLSPPSQHPTRVTVRVGARGDSAVRGADFDLGGRRPDGAAADVREIVVPGGTARLDPADVGLLRVRADGTADDQEVATVEVLGVSANARPADATRAVVRLRDPVLPTVDVVDVRATESSGGDATLVRPVVRLSRPVTGRTVRVGWATTDGTAVAGRDYTAGRGTAVVPSGASEVRLPPIRVAADAVDEADEQLRIRVTSVDYGRPVDGAGDVWIEDDDTVEVQSLAAVVVDESATERVAAELRVRLAAAAERPVIVHWSTLDGPSTASRDRDYWAVDSKRLVFQPGETEMIVAVQIKPDASRECDEHVVVGVEGDGIRSRRGRVTIRDRAGCAGSVT